MAKKEYDRARYLRIRVLRPRKTLVSKYRFVNDGKKSSLTAHKVLVEKVIGHSLPNGAHVHHVDYNGHNNEHSNLVVCPSQAYHMLLHRRQRALDACGNANWFKCVFCKEYDARANLTLYVPKDQTSPRANHPRCATEYGRGRRVSENSSR